MYSLAQTHADLLLGCRDDSLGVFVYVRFKVDFRIKKKGETQAHAHAPPKGYITFLATARTINHLITINTKTYLIFQFLLYWSSKYANE